MTFWWRAKYQSTGWTRLKKLAKKKKTLYSCQFTLIHSLSSLLAFLLPADRRLVMERWSLNVNLPLHHSTNGETHTVEFNPGSNQVEVGQYQYREETVSQDKRNQGWRRWSTNSDRYGKVNSWNELNIKTGELRYIGMNGQIKFSSSCSQVNWALLLEQLDPIKRMSEL